MLPSMPVASAEAQRLAKLLKGLSSQDRESLFAFAEFLQQRSQQQEGEAALHEGPVEPAASSRPDEESVVAAIRRLKEQYRMIDESELLHETADLMSSHLLNGRPASEVIDDLEELFAAKYTRYRKTFTGSD